jgi:hypothetical protein
MAKNRQTGAKMYFLRLLIAHLHESMKIIKDIKKTPELMEAVEACEEKTQNDFAAVWALVGTADYKSIMTMRNKIGSHWDDDVVEPAIFEMNQENPDYSMLLSLGDEMLDWHFDPADRIIDRVVVKKVFDIPKGADIEEEVDKIVRRLFDVVDALVSFAGHFIRHHTRKG